MTYSNVIVKAFQKVLPSSRAEVKTVQETLVSKLAAHPLASCVVKSLATLLLVMYDARIFSFP